MRSRTLVLILLIALVAGFAALNWAAFTAPTKLSLGVSTFEGPLGLVLLAILVAVVLLFVGYMALWQGRLLVEARRHAKELQSQRALADQAEASRFTDLRAALDQASEHLGARVDAAREALRTELHEATNSLAAMIGEIDDRAKRDVDRRP